MSYREFHWASLTKINFHKVAWFMLEPIFVTSAAAFKNDARFKSDQK